MSAVKWNEREWEKSAEKDLRDLKWNAKLKLKLGRSAWLEPYVS